MFKCCSSSRNMMINSTMILWQILLNWKIIDSVIKLQIELKVILLKKQKSLQKQNTKARTGWFVLKCSFSTITFTTVRFLIVAASLIEAPPPPKLGIFFYFYDKSFII